MLIVVSELVKKVVMVVVVVDSVHTVKKFLLREGPSFPFPDWSRSSLSCEESMVGFLEKKEVIVMNLLKKMYLNDLEYSRQQIFKLHSK